jgi:hypothetical protein
MPWARFDDEFDDDPELDLIGPVAACLFVCSVTWCNRNLTDGFLPKARAAKLTGGVPESVASLLKYGWWTVDGDGYRVRNFLKYNMSAEQVATERERANDRQKRYLDKKRSKGGKSYNAVNHSVIDGVNNNVDDTVMHGVCDVSSITNGVNDAGSRNPSPESRVLSPESQPTTKPPSAPPEPSVAANGRVVGVLLKFGVSEPKAKAIAAKYPSELIDKQIAWLPGRKARNPAAVLVKSIESDWAEPDGEQASVQTDHKNISRKVTAAMVAPITKSRAEKRA